MTRPEFEDKVVQVANAWLNVPYRDNGRTRRGGVDCLGLIACVYWGCGFKDCPDGDGRPYSMDWYYGKNNERYLEGFRRAGQEISFSDLRPGDIVMFRTDSKLVTHGGVFVGDGFIHAINRPPTDGVIKSPFDRFWKRAFAGGLRPNFLPVE